MVGLVELDLIAGGVVQEYLLPGALDVIGALVLDAFGREVLTPLLDIVDVQRVVRHGSFGCSELHQVDLLRARVEPVSGEAEVGPVLTHPTPEHVDVEAPRHVHIVDADRHMVHTSKFHDAQSGTAPLPAEGRYVRPMFADPSSIDVTLDARSISFENPTGARGAGGVAAGGRKGAPSRVVAPGERITLADIAGPGTIRHIWCTVPPMAPEQMRALTVEVFYNGRDEPSISVPLLDFFGVACGRPRAYTSALTSAHEGRGFNAYFPMPFHEQVRVEFVNGAARPCVLYFQIDYTLQRSLAPDVGMLHAEFRRENPTALRHDFTITDGWHGPGRFLGCVVGVRPIDAGSWYGEGEVKVYRDGDEALPTICGTGLEDYVGSAWGMGAHHGLYAGAPLVAGNADGGMLALADFVGFYRWHVPDPIVFHDGLRVTIQQIGMHAFGPDDLDARDGYVATNPIAGNGWHPRRERGAWVGLFERVDDYSAAAFVYLRDAQAVRRVEVAHATADLARRDYERPDPMEAFLR